MDLKAIDLCQIFFEARASELAIDPVAGGLRLDLSEADPHRLAEAGYIHVLAQLSRTDPISAPQFRCLVAMAEDPDWQRSYLLEDTVMLDTIGRRILARTGVPGQPPRSVSDLRELFKSMRGHWDTILSHMDLVM